MTPSSVAPMKLKHQVPVSHYVILKNKASITFTTFYKALSGA